MSVLRFAALAALSAAVAACSDAPSQRSATPAAQAPPDTAAVRKAAREYRVQYNAPVDLDSTDFYYQPISVVPLDAENRSRSFSYSSNDTDSRGGIEGTCYNILFFSKSTLSEQALLAHGRFVLTEIDDNRKPDVRWPFLFYTIVKADTNNDGAQDGQDASALFVSGRSGQQLRQLTPDGTRLESRQLLPKTSLLLVEVRPDVNKDGKFTHADGTYWLRFDLRNLAAGPVRQPATALTGQLRQQMLERQSQRLPQ